MNTTNHPWLHISKNPSHQKTETTTTTPTVSGSLESKLSEFISSPYLKTPPSPETEPTPKNDTKAYAKTYTLNHASLKSFTRVSSGLGLIEITFHGSQENKTSVYHETTTQDTKNTTHGNPNPVFTVTKHGATLRARHTKTLKRATVLHPAQGITHTTITNTSTGDTHTYKTPQNCKNQQIVLSLISVGHQLITHITTQDGSPASTARVSPTLTSTKE